MLAPLGSVRAAVGEAYHEVKGGGSMLWSSLAPLSGGDARNKIGFGGGASYIYHFNNQLSFHSGLEATLYGGNSHLGDISELSTVIIPEEWLWKGDQSFELRSHFSSYAVQHSAVYLQMPLLVGYERTLPQMEWLSWYVTGGFRLGLPLWGESSAQMDNITMEGYFDYEDYPIDDIKNLLGFGSYPSEHRSAALELGFSATSYLELGLKQKLMEGYNLYIGIFGEYSLYSALGGNTRSHIYEYEALPFSTGSYYRIRYTPASHVTGTYSRTFYPMAFGITLRFGIEINRMKFTNTRMLQMRYMDF